MKIKISMKNPDVLDILNEDVIIVCSSESEEEVDSIIADIETWFKYGEYIQLEYDTDTKEMSVIKP